MRAPKIQTGVQATELTPLKTSCEKTLGMTVHLYFSAKSATRDDVHRYF
jgi:hypothetical protein